MHCIALYSYCKLSWKCPRKWWPEKDLGHCALAFYEKSAMTIYE